MKTIEYSISEADAVRHLIVCDTQFTWAGVTNLTLPQMMDLQARGWVVEGDDNDEFQLTEAGEAVVARALQHGVPKTLADVQPGGRVRLGDRLVLAKLVGAAGLMLAEIDTCGHEIDPAYRHTLYEAWEEGKATLSAQPSPGGQDALDCIGRIEEAIEFRVPHDIYAAVHGELAELKAALAARQPVASNQPSGNSGELAVDTQPVGYANIHQLNDPRNDGVVLRRKDDDGFFTEPLYRRPPAQAVDLGQFRALAAFGEEFAFSAEKHPQSRVVYAQANRLLALIDSSAVQSVQAVDLGQFRPFIMEARNNAYAFIETMRKAGRDSSDAREKAALTERLLDLIDSQAVGK